jgi:hypothetical protein
MGATAGKTKFEDIGDIDLQNITLSENIFPANLKSADLWRDMKDKLCIVLVVRRSGCSMCREQAGLIKELLEFNKDCSDIHFYAIVHENVENDVAEFQDYCTRHLEHPNFAMFLDTDRKFYAAQGNRWGSIFDLISASLFATRRAARRGITGGSMSGEGRLLGGVLLMTADEIIYEHREKKYGDFLENEILLQVIETYQNQTIK